MIEERRVDLSDSAENRRTMLRQVLQSAWQGRQKKRAEAFVWRGLRLVGSGVDEKNGGNLTQIG